MKFFKIVALWISALLATVLLFVLSVLMGSGWAFEAIIFCCFGVVIFLIMRGFEALLACFYPLASNSASWSAFVAVCGYFCAYFYMWFAYGKTDFKNIGSMILGTVVCLYLLKVSGKILNQSTVRQTLVRS